MTTRGVRIWLVPSFGVLLFVAHPLQFLISPDKMLTDPGIGWHLQSGRYMLEHGELLRHDLFSYTRPDGPWVVFAWLFQCVAAALDQLGGLPLLTATAALVFAGLPLVLYRRMLREGANIFVAFALSGVGYLGLVSHSHVRPHIITYLCFAVVVERLTAFERGRASAQSLLLLVPLMAIWVNVHGGFLVGLAVIALFFVVAFVESIVSRDLAARDRARTFLLTGIGMSLASLVNPRGWGLHLSAIDLLGLTSTGRMREFMSPDFNLGIPVLYVFEAALLSLLVLLGRKRRRLSWAECTLLAVFLFQTLHAIRHAFLFILVAMPILARELSGLLEGVENRFTRRSARALAEQGRLKSDRVWIPALCVLFLVLSQTAPGLFRHDLYGTHLSRNAAAYIRDNPDRFERIFNTSDLGGTLIYHFWPDLKIFADDRNPYYGEDFYIDEFFEILLMGDRWQEVLDKYEVTAAVIGRSDASLGTLFKASPKWELVLEDDLNTIFLRRSSVDP